MLRTPDEWFLYLRKSVGYAGIQRQRTATTDYLAGMGGHVIADGEFSDADRTAYRDPLASLPPRPGFDRMLAELERRPGTGVAAWHLDRLGRDPEAAEVLIRACMRGGHLIATRSGGTYDCTTANGRKHLRDDVNNAAHEVDHNTERVLEAMREIRAAGRWGGGKVPFGWRLDPTATDSDGEPLHGILILHEPEARLVRDGTAAVTAGASLQSVARDWAAATGRPWSHILVRQVLQRPLNAALMALGGEVVGEGGWPQIVTAAQWRACRAVLADPARRTSPGPERRHLLSGIALCGTCGTALGSGGSGSRVQYRCRRLRAAPILGAHACRTASPIDALVTVLALGRLRQPDAELLLRPDHRADRDALLVQEAAEQAEHAALGRLRLQRAISDRELIDGRAEIAATLERIRGQLAALDQADVLAPFVASPEAAWERAAVDVRRSVVAVLMHVTVFPSRQGRPPGTARGERWFDVDSVDVRWVRALPSDG
jgi:site-specific DNA recombinase